MSSEQETATQTNPVVAVERTAQHEVSWGFMQWLCSGAQFADAQQTFGYVEILPGRKNPRHLHPNSDEVLYLLDGELDHRIDDQVFRLQAGMAIHIPQGAEHDARNTGATVARMVVAYPTADRQVVMCEAGEE
jgi:quercetin dioxygenase-like cupin family protein